MKQHCLVLDGHDGAGKTVLAQLLAEHTGGRYVKPFNGSLGDTIAWLYERERFDLTNQIAHVAIEKVYSEHANEPLLIFDRHWLSMFTVLPEAYYSSWLPLPPTILCWTDVATTCSRLIERGEPVGDVSQHAYYCRRYHELAEQLAIPVLDTTRRSVAESLEWLLAHPLVQALQD